MSGGEADPESDRFYDYLENRYGREDPRSSSYRSVRSFEHEARAINTVLSNYEGLILDVACGHGLITAKLVAKGRYVFGLDYNGSAIYSAARRGLIAVRGDAFCMPFNGASFDVVLSTSFLQQFDPDQLKKFMDELARITRPGGVLVLVWRNGTSLMRHLITSGLRILDWAQGRPAIRSLDHSFGAVRDWAKEHQFELIDSLSLCPLLGLTIPKVESLGCKLLGTSYLAVMRRSQ